MVYSSRFVACVLLGDKPTKELVNGVVPVPFGTEYSLRFRNKNDRRALVKFTIDKENVSGGGYVIEANSFIDIHRHSNKDARFRFVELDSPDAIDFGKNGPNTDGSKGVIDVKFYLEKEKAKPAEIHHHHHWYDSWKKWGGNWGGDAWPTLNNPYVPTNKEYKNKNYEGCGIMQPDAIPDLRGQPPSRPSGVLKNTNDFTQPCTDQAKIDNLKLQILAQTPAILGIPVPLQDGVTVEGSVSGQKFQTVYFEQETDFVAVKLILQGYQGTPVASDSMTYCGNCGAKRARKNDNFCSLCGHKH